MLKLSVIPFLERIEKVGRGMRLPVVLNLFIAFNFDNLTIVQCKTVCGVLQVLVLDKAPLKSFRVEPEGGTTLEALVVGVHVDVLEVFKREICRDIGCFGD